MKLIIVRHGITEENKRNIAQGQLPGSLSEEGEIQARKIGEKLSERHIDIIFSSDLDRAKNTTDIIKTFFPKVFTRLSKKLREKDFGDFQGKPYPKNWNEMVWAGGILKEHGGEANWEIFKRIKDFLKKIKTKYDEKTVLLVTHKRVIQTILALKNKIDIEDMKNMKIPKNGEIFEIEL